MPQYDRIDDLILLDTRIPECRRVSGLIYGAHYTAPSRAWSGYYVRPEGWDIWCLARVTPAHDELPGDGSDREILAAIAAELMDLARPAAVALPGSTHRRVLHPPR